MDGNAAPFDEHALSKFFDHFRQRLSVLDRLHGVPQAEPECHVLVQAELDELAAHWWGTFNREKIHHGPRIQAFLRACGQTELFDRCSRSELLRFAERHRAKYASLRAVIRALLRETDAAAGGERLSWQDDPLLIHVQQRLARAGIMLAPDETRELKRTRYGDSLYSERRGIWAAELTPSSRALDLDQPWFRNNVRTDANGNLLSGTERQVVLPWSVLRRTLEECIGVFERQCRFTSTLPSALRN
jgi:hypothetical protein